MRAPLSGTKALYVNVDFKACDRFDKKYSSMEHGNVADNGRIPQIIAVIIMYLLTLHVRLFDASNQRSGLSSSVITQQNTIHQSHVVCAVCMCVCTALSATL